MGNAEAREVLLAAAAGRPLSDELITQLADAVLADAREPLRLALAIRAGGEHVVRHAIELAALLLANPSATRSFEAS